ncbi:uncharacterized protein LOC123537626 [Mercenaria mercenaria]|uniref:uncharacterized protein LOC123537626 n=1 Tax=Mercenaria mercenaria TaxID=6596 RepID=UPI00234F472C|nr:uncharacterized protein LOC123537626 [Mercenaria mercenaria]
MPGHSKFLTGPSAPKKSRYVFMSSLGQKTDSDVDSLESLLSSPRRGKSKSRPRFQDDFQTCDCSGCTGIPSDSSDAESDEDPAVIRIVLESDSESFGSNGKFEGIERQYENNVDDDIKNIGQSVLDHFHCEVVLDDGVCEMHRPGCRYCRCLADCPRWKDPDVCPLQWKELFEEKVNDPKDYHQIMKYSKLYHTIYSEGTAMYLYTDEVMAMCRTHKNHLCLDRTFNIGPSYVVMFMFRNKNLYIKADKNKRSPLMLGPVLLHFDLSSDATFIPFFDHIKRLCGITTEEKTPKEFDQKSLKGIPMKQRSLYEGIRQSFGDSVNFCERNNLPRLLHGKMKKEVTCYSKLKDLIKVLYEQYEEDKKHVMDALIGRGKWRLTEHAQEVMKNSGSGNTLKDFAAIELAEGVL